MSGLWIWLGAALLYAAFRAGYDNRRGPIRADEIERFLKAVEDTPSAALNDLGTLITIPLVRAALVGSLRERR